MEALEETSDSVGTRKTRIVKRSCTLDAMIAHDMPVEIDINKREYNKIWKSTPVGRFPTDDTNDFLWKYYVNSFLQDAGGARVINVEPIDGLIFYDNKFRDFLTRNNFHSIVTAPYKFTKSYNQIVGPESGVQFDGIFVSNYHGMLLSIAPDGATNYVRIIFPESLNLKIVSKIVEELRSLAVEVEHNYERETPWCYIVVKNLHGYDLVQFDVRMKSKEIDLDLFYPNVNNTKIEDFFTKEPHELFGKLLLMCGQPGTGKTTYIRHLITHTIDPDTNVVFMNSDVFQRIGTPEFATFALSRLQNSIVVIEDAEKILVSRDQDSKSPISDLLNITDGILGDALNMKIIATYNTETSKVDSALRRPGRLYHMQEFVGHNKEQAQKFLDTIAPGASVSEDKTWPLANLFEIVVNHNQKEK